MSSFVESFSDARMAQHTAFLDEIDQIESVILESITKTPAATSVTIQARTITIGVLRYLAETRWKGVVREIANVGDGEYHYFLQLEPPVAEQAAMVVLECGREFSSEMAKRTGRKTPYSREHLLKMLADEEQERIVALDKTEVIDAYLDMAFYAADSYWREGAARDDQNHARQVILDSMRKIVAMRIDPLPLIRIVHEANMSKFNGGYLREDGKWMKPANFVAPDEKLRREINRQFIRFG